MSLILIVSYLGINFFNNRVLSKKRPKGFYTSKVFKAEYEMFVLKDAINLFYKNNKRLPKSNDFQSLKMYLDLKNSKTENYRPISPYGTPYYFYSITDFYKDDIYSDWANNVNFDVIIVCTGPDEELDILLDYNYLSNVSSKGDIVLPVYFSLTPWETKE